jgi:hypothetical protein
MNKIPSLSRIGILLTLTTIITGCQTASTSRAVPTINYNISTAEVGGIVIGSSPRIVARTLADRGFVPSKSSTITLDDLIPKYDRGQFYDHGIIEQDHVNYAKNENTPYILDDERITISFCVGKVYKIFYQHNIFGKDFERYKEEDTKKYSFATPQSSENANAIFSLGFKGDRQGLSVNYRKYGFDAYIYKDDGDKSSSTGKELIEKQPVYDRMVIVDQWASCYLYGLSRIRG